MALEIKVPVEELRKNKIFLATPMYGGVNSGMFCRSVMDLAAICAQYGIPLYTYFLFNESLITRARNYCCDEFLRSDATHMMFIDSDIGFNPNDVIALLAMQRDDSPYDVIGGPYPKKCISWEKVKMAVDKGFADENPNELDRFVGDYVFNPKAGTQQIRVDEPCEVMEIGTGFMMIRRATFDKFREFYGHLHYKPDHVRTEHFDGTREIMAYFDCVIDRGYDVGDLQRIIQEGVDIKGNDADRSDLLEEWKTKAKALLDREATASKRYLSEDYKFCYDLMRAGLKTWLCPWMKLQHAGTYVFGGSLVDMAQLGASATADVEQLNKIKAAEKKKRAK